MPKCIRRRCPHRQHSGGSTVRAGKVEAWMGRPRSESDRRATGGLARELGRPCTVHVRRSRNGVLGEPQGLGHHPRPTGPRDHFGGHVLAGRGWYRRTDTLFSVVQAKVSCSRMPLSASANPASKCSSAALPTLSCLPRGSKQPGPPQEDRTMRRR